MLQDYLCRRADKHMIPKVDNTNVDRSVATIHATVLACLRHTSQVKLCRLLLLFLLLLLLFSQVATIHATVLACLHHISQVKSLLPLPRLLFFFCQLFLLVVFCFFLLFCCCCCCRCCCCYPRTLQWDGCHHASVLAPYISAHLMFL